MTRFYLLFALNKTVQHTVISSDVLKNTLERDSPILMNQLRNGVSEKLNESRIKKISCKAGIATQVFSFISEFLLYCANSPQSE